MSDPVKPTVIRQKWRPPLALVLGATLFAVLSLPVIGLLMLRWAGPVLGYEQAMIGISIGIVVVTVGIGYVLWRILLGPVRAMAARAADIKAGRAGALKPLAHYGTSELRDLGQAMLDMGASLQNRSAGLRAYTDHVTHEMKSPLTSIIGAAELLGSDMAASDRVQLMTSIQTSAARMQDHLEGLRALAAAREAMGAGVVMLSDAAAQVQIGLPIVVARDGQVPMTHTALIAVVTQLGQNAAQYGARELRLDWTGTILQIADDGSGIADGNRTRIFDPFFTTNRAQGGTGLGLNIVRNILESAGGEISLMPKDVTTAKGAAFEIRF